MKAIDNFIIASNIFLNSNKNNGIICVFNISENFATGFVNCVDIFVFSKKLNFFDWIWGIEKYDDLEIEFPEYNWFDIVNKIKKIFRTENLIIYQGNFKVPDYIEEKIIESVSITRKIVEKNLNQNFFNIYYFKIQMFLNYMDTDSIPFYLKNIAVLFRENGDFDKSFFYLKKAWNILKINDIADETAITLLKMQKYNLCIKLCKKYNSIKCMQCLAFCYKIKGDYKKSLLIYEKLEKQCSEDWIKNDIIWLKNEIIKKN